MDDDWYFCGELGDDDTKAVERALYNELLFIFDNCCGETWESDSDNKIDVDGGVV